MLREPVIKGNKVVEKAISSPTLKEPNIDLIEDNTVKIRPRPYNRNPIVLLLVNRKSRYRWVFNLPNKSGPIVANAIKGFFRGLRNGFGRYPTKFHFDKGTEITDLLTTWLAKRGIKFSTSAPYIYEQNGLVERSVRVILDLLKTSTVKFIEDNIVLSQPTNNTALEGELVDLDLDLKGAVSPDPSNLNTKKPISIEIGPSKLEPYESSSDKPIFAPKPLEVIAPHQPITNEPLNNSDLILEGDKTQLDYYKLLAKTSSYILSFVYKARKRVISKDSTPTTYKQVLKLPRDKRTASNKAIYKLLLKYSYNPSTPNIIKLSKALYSLKQSPREVFFNAKTCHFIVLYIDNCLFIGPDIGYITDLKKRLNKVYAIEDLGPTTYFLGMSLNRPIKSHLNAAKNLFKYLNSTKDYSICFSCNGNTVANLGPKLSSSSNITIKLIRDFYSKEGPRPLTTTFTTIVDSRNGKGSSRTSIINSSLVPIGFSDSDFTGDKAISKSTYSYLYKLASRPISWKTKRATTITLSTLEAKTDRLIEAICKVQTKHTLLKFRDVREQVKAKIVTIIYLNTKYMPADGLTKALLVNSFSNSDNSVYTILGISTILLAPASTPTKLAKITLAERYIAAYKAKRRKAAKACAIAGRAAAAKRRKKRKEAVANIQARKLAKKEGLQRSKRTASGNAGRYTTNSSLIANKDDNNTYNRAYMPLADAEEEEEEEGGSGNNNSVNSSTSNSTDKGKGSSTYKHSKGFLRYKDIPLYKRQYVTSYPYSPPSAPRADIYVHYV
ncbi:hypothetical protein P8C59_000108 [Phyllachora maydis]|uniref:Integrase catalytic domain-containing protein n=1 Tax=Phyllachora maydis TaxID=1825666 RepID=A0AAD9HWZ7_9PEZI|nr:hypothetical protein P8C59_000108 [Phyllachora maydis]